MSKPYPGPWVLRTMLFTPGHREEMIRKSVASKADCVVLDLEDAVPEVKKGEARLVIRRILDEGIFSKKPVMVRINPMDTGHTLFDLNAVACKNLNGFVFPKPFNPDDIKVFDAQLNLKEMELGLPKGHFEIVIIIETSRAVLDVLNVANAVKRTVGLIFGCEDYLADVQGKHNEGELSLLVARSMVVMAARAAGIIPVDTPYVQVHDSEGFQKHLQQGNELGYEGILVMTPTQIEQAHEVHTPKPDIVAEAKEIVQLSDKARKENLGIAVYNGKFISPPTEKQARLILDRFNKIDTYEKNCGIK